MTFKKTTIFGEPSTPITFANEITEFKKDTIKVQVKVLSWPFRSLQNSLQLVFETQYDNNVDPDCAETSSSQDSNGNLNWFSINVEGFELYLFHMLFSFLLHI